VIGKIPLALVAALATTQGRALPADDDSLHIRWVRVASTAEATQACRERFPHWPATGIGGCYYRAGEVCTVVAPDPAIRTAANGKRWYDFNQWAALGHEVKHCFDGYFHD
jgi:hypothetical protein